MAHQHNSLLTSVRVRLTLWYVAILALVLIGFSVGVYIFLVESIDADVTSMTKTYQHELTQQAAQSPSNPKIKVPLNSSPVGLVSVTYQNESTGREAKFGAVRNLPSIRLNLEQTLFKYSKQGCHSTVGNRLVCTWLVYKQHQVVGAVGFQASLDGVTHAQARLRTALLVGVPLCLLVALLGGWTLASRALAPVEEVRRKAQSITATDLSRRIALRRNDELGRLAATLDDMIHRLETAFCEQRQLTEDVSHELRTPLAVIQAQTSLALKRQRSVAEYTGVLTSVQEETERMSRIVSDLLLLARGQSGQMAIEREPVRLDSIAAWAAGQVKNMATRKSLQLRLVAEPVLLEGDLHRLRQLVLNLVDNAVKYTPSGGRVVVVVQVEDGLAVLRVADSGEGIDPHDLPHIFQRFFRADRSRSRGEGGSGLGLAIVQWVVEAHSGSVEVKSQVGSGTVFTVHLPLHAAQQMQRADDERELPARRRQISQV